MQTMALKILKPFYFIRHGETDWNSKNIIMGSQDIPLNSKGIQQAHHASDFLLNQNITLVVSSPRSRARQTADIIAEKIKAPILIEDGISERNWGNLEGKSFNPGDFIFDEHCQSHGVEFFSDHCKRVKIAIEKYLIMNDRTTLFVSHGGSFVGLLHSLGIEKTDSPNCEPYLFLPPQNQTQRWHHKPLAEMIDPYDLVS